MATTAIALQHSLRMTRVADNRRRAGMSANRIGAILECRTTMRTSGTFVDVAT